MVPVGDVPKPIKPPVLLKDFTDLHPAELARQMALAEFGFYRKIQPTECLDLVHSPPPPTGRGRDIRVGHSHSSDNLQTAIGKQPHTLKGGTCKKEKSSRAYRNGGGTTSLRVAVGCVCGQKIIEK